MLIEQALYKELAGTSGVTDLVGTRIYYVKAPQDVTTPYLVLTKVTGPREHSHDGSSNLAHPRFQVDVFSETYYEAKQIAEQAQTALQGFSGTLGGGTGVSTGAIFYDNEIDIYEEETKLFHLALDFIIWHTE